jgi:hypothetical protein
VQANEKGVALPSTRRILKTKFYPVSIDYRTIIDDPHDLERTLAWKYRGKQCYIGIKGKHLLGSACYSTYQWVST